MSDLLGRSQAESDLTRKLAQTLVQKEVLEPMEKIGWSHATPPAPDYSGQPAAEGAPDDKAKQQAPAGSGPPAPGGTASPQKPDASKATGSAPGFEFNIEDFKNPTTGKYFDKYDTPAEALKGLGHLAHMAKTSFRERDAALERASKLEQELQQRQTPASTPGAAPAPNTVSAASRADVDRAQAAYDAVLSQVAEDGGILDAEAAKKLSRAQSELSQAHARFAAEERALAERNAQSAESARWSRVNEYMHSKYPDAERFADEIGLHVQTDPLLSKAVAALVSQGNEIEASEMAWLSFQRAQSQHGAAVEREKAEEKEVDLQAREQVRKEAVERARRDAGVIQGSAGGGGSHEAPPQPSQSDINSMGQEMLRQGTAPGTPAAARWRHAVIGRFLDPRLFGGG